MSSTKDHDSPRRLFLPLSRTGWVFVAILSAALATLGVDAARQFFRSGEESASSGSPDGRVHARPIVERDGHRLLWARGDSEADDAEWFDVTNSKIDPDRFQYGIGKDRIASIDTPLFVAADDPRLREFGIDDRTPVIGFVHDGDARAYPLKILDEHELVNDTVGGKPVTVGW